MQVPPDKPERQASSPKTGSPKSTSPKPKSPGSPTRSKSFSTKGPNKDTEVDMELVLYEFVEVLVRVAFWRANPFHGIHKLAAKLTPLPDCLHQMLHEVVLPNAKRDDSALFKERLAGDKAMQTALLSYETKLREWCVARIPSPGSKSLSRCRPA